MFGECLSGPHGDAVVLAANQVNGVCPGGGKAKPRADGLVRALLGPGAAERLYFDGGRLGALHSHAALYRRKACGRPLKVKDGSTARKQGCELLSLNASDFGVVSCHCEDG